MKKLLLFLALVFAIAYAYHWYSGKIASTPASEEPPATPVVVHRATPKPKPQVTSLETKSLGTSGLGKGTPDSKANPLAAPPHH
jgi:hypothetical protein